MRRLVILMLCAAVLCGVWADAEAGALRERVVRLHVMANSNSAEDQSAKLAARDRVLALSRELLRDARNAREAENILAANLDELRRAAGENASAAIEERAFPTRSYGFFTLPAGSYTALSVRLGSGEGENWWCVLFPALCETAAAERTLSAAGFTESEIALVTADGFEIKFKCVELWGRLTALLRGIRRPGSV